MVVAAMVAGADSIDDVDRLQHSAMPVVFDEIKEPSTVGTFLLYHTRRPSRHAPLNVGATTQAAFPTARTQYLISTGQTLGKTECGRC